MANPKLISASLASIGSLTDIHTSQRNPLGLRVGGTDAAGNYAEYIYMQGVANGLRGSWVVYDELFVTTLLVANGLGAVAIGMSANAATTTFGWYCVYGAVQGLCLASYADNAKVWATSTAGSVDDADVAVDLITGAVGRSARATSGANSGMALFQISYPFAHNEVVN